MIPAVAAARQRVGLGHPLEVDTRDVVEQQVVVEREQLPEPRDQMPFQRRLVQDQPIQRPIQPIVVDQGRRQREQVFQCRATVPGLGDVQLARGLTQPGQHQHSRHRGPRHGLAAFGQQPGQHLVEFQRPPERPAKPHIAEHPATLQPDALEPNRNRLVGVVRDEQIRLRAVAGDRPGQRLGASAPLGVEFSEVGDRLLHDLPADADGADQLPVPVDLPVFPARRVTQVHYPVYRARRPTKSTYLVATTRRFRPSAADGRQSYNRRGMHRRAGYLLNCGSWASRP